MSSEAIILVNKLINTGAVPENLRPDAQHIAIATVNNIKYLISWNYKHIVLVKKIKLYALRKIAYDTP